MIGGVGLLTAFAAGAVSFLSPCVLPLYPAYVTFMTGLSLGEIEGERRSTRAVLVPVLVFVVGFTAVFVAMGAGASAIGSLLATNRLLLERVGGVVIALLGIVLLDVIPLPWLRNGLALDTGRLRGLGLWGALVLGMSFPLALGPCAGPVYGFILTLAGTAGRVLEGSVLLAVYSLGLAVPFVVTALFLGRFGGAIRWLNKRAHTVNRVAGAVLLVFGVAMATGALAWVVNRLNALPFPTIHL